MSSSTPHTILIYGIHPITEVLRAKKRKIYTLYCLNKNAPKTHDIIKKLPQYARVLSITRDSMNHMVQSADHQGMVAAVTPFIFKKAFFSPKTHPLIIMIDRIHDPRNLGAILRSAYCTKTIGVIITAQESSAITAASFKASAGLAEFLDIFEVRTVTEGLQRATSAGYTCYAACFNGAPLYSLQPEKGSCIIVGNEEKGVDERVYDYAKKITIPQVEHEISFNVSVASGIIMSYFSQHLKQI